MALDINLDLLDDELVRRGIRPEAIAALSSAAPSPSGSADVVRKAAGTSADPRVSFVQPGTRDYNLRLAATNRPRLSFVGPRTPEPAAPDMSGATPGGAGFSFVAGQPARPAELAAPAGNPADPSAQGTPPVSFLRQPPRAPITGGPQDVEAAQATGAVPAPNTNPNLLTPAARLMRSANQANAGSPYAAGPAERQFEEMDAEGAPQLHGLKKVLDVAGQILAPGIEQAIPGTPGNFNRRLIQLAGSAAEEQRLRKGDQELDTAAAQAQFNTPEKRRAYMQQNPGLFDDVSDFQKNDWVLSGKFPQKEPAPEKTADKKIDEYTDNEGRRVLTFQRADGSVYDSRGGETQGKQGGHTSPFEAFAYGDPQEKQAAQDFLDLEHKLNSKYRTESEFQEKYRLFKEDPDTYKAMFGDKSADKPDRATATKMLNYFDRRRREIQQDFTLDDQQKQQQLQDVENLEKPFLDAVQPGAGGRGGGGDRIEVIHPNGQHGTIPRSQLDAAKKKGYREASPR